MVTLKCLGSSSNGNCYLLKHENDVLIIDCGVSIKDIKKGLDFQITGIKGVVISHGHWDHLLALKDLRSMRIPVFAPFEKAEKKIQKVTYGPFKITALPLLDKAMEKWQHTNGDQSECPCFAFVIEVDNQKILYVTDTKLLVWNLQKWCLDHILIGLNYIPADKEKGEYKMAHVLTGHLGLPAVKEIVRTNYTGALQNVILCHMSNQITDRQHCINAVKEVAKSANIDIATKNKEWSLYGANECPF